MNSTFILFLNMLKSDIKRYIYERNGVTYDAINNLNDAKMLTGQTIKRKEIENLSSFKLMNPEEIKLFEVSILDNPINSAGIEQGKRLVKHNDSIMPYMYNPGEAPVEFKDAA